MAILDLVLEWTGVAEFLSAFDRGYLGALIWFLGSIPAVQAGCNCGFIPKGRASKYDAAMAALVAVLAWAAVIAIFLVDFILKEEKLENRRLIDKKKIRRQR